MSTFAAYRGLLGLELGGSAFTIWRFWVAGHSKAIKLKTLVAAQIDQA
jgi:hypothetical protein